MKDRIGFEKLGLAGPQGRSSKALLQADPTVRPIFYLVITSIIGINLLTLGLGDPAGRPRWMATTSQILIGCMLLVALSGLSWLGVGAIRRNAPHGAIAPTEGHPLLDDELDGRAARSNRG